MPFLEPFLDPFLAWRRAAASRPLSPGPRDRFGIETGSIAVRRCGNPECATRRRFSPPWKPKDSPRFEGQPICSRDCLRAVVAAALQREMGEAQPGAEPYSHRIPLGLFMLSRRSITREQLSGAIASQKRAGHGRIGEWLVRTQGVDEEVVAHALAAQWGLPFLPAKLELRMARFLPRLWIEAFGVVPVHLAANRILYLAVDQQVDRCLHAAIEWMTGYKVEPGVMKQSVYLGRKQAVLAEPASPARLFSSASIEGLEDGIIDLIAESSSTSSRFVRVRDYIWLRSERVDVAPPLVPVDEVSTHFEDAIFTLPRAIRQG